MQDTLPSGVQFVSAVPAQNSGPNPLRWVVGNMLPGQKFESLVTVRASGNGALENRVCVDSDQIDTCADDITPSGTLPYLKQTKSVSPTTVAPGGTVQYTINIENIGTGATGSPYTINEYLPAGFTYVSKDNVTVNGANVTAATTVNSSNLNKPIFTVPSAINAGQSLLLTFTAQVSSVAGNYCNFYTATQNGIPLTTGSLACVTVGDGRIGDTIYRDWDGSGTQDPAEEGIAGVTVKLYAANGTTLLATTSTDANGNYYFPGLTAGTYVVQVNDGVTLLSTTLTDDPDATLDNRHTVVLATNQQYLSADFGYQPGGAGGQGGVGNVGVIGDQVFDDKGNDGFFNIGTDIGIPGITVYLYADRNGDGIINPATDALVKTTTTNASGVYGFTFLGEGYNYIVYVDQADANLISYFGGGAFVPTTADPHSVANLTGTYSSADFGFYKVVPGSIGDLVWYDLDADGVKDANESGLGAVSVKLYQDSNGNGIVDSGEPLLATTVTDPSGIYSFNNLPVGTYVVDVDESDADIPDSLAPSRDPIAVTLGVAESKTDVDFPFVQALTKTVDLTTASPGNQLTYTIYPRYFGSQLLTGAVINDTIPVGTTYVAASINAGGEAVDDDDIPDGVIDRVAWDLGSNNPGSVGYSGGAAMCPATATLTADKDTHIFSNATGDNAGGSAKLNADSDAIQHALLHFDISSLPVGAVIDNAQVKVTVESGQNANRTVSVRKLTFGPWTEGSGAEGGTACASAGNGATWNQPVCTGTGWNGSGGNFATAAPYGSELGSISPAVDDTTYAATVTSAVQDWYATPANNYGLALLGVGSDMGTIKFHSRTGTAGSEPKLVVNYRVPTAGGCSGTVSLAAVADTYIQQDSGGNDNFGTITTLKIRPETAKKKHALLRFDVNGIPVGATLTAATLKMIVSTAKSNTTSEIHRMTTAWVEGTDATDGAQWNDPNGTGTAGTWSAGAFSTADYNATTVGTLTPSTSGLKTADVKTLVLGWQTGVYSNTGIVLLTTGTSTSRGDAAYRSREDGTASNRPVIDVSWTIPPSSPTRVNTLSASPLLVVEGDKITVKMVLQNSTGSAVTSVTPSALTVTAAGGGTYSCATLTGPSPASQTVAANSSATFTWTCTTNTAPTLSGSLTFSATASGTGPTTWTSSSSESALVTPPLTFKAEVKTPPGVAVATNQADLTLAFPSTEGLVCYVMADGFDANDVDYLRRVDRATGVVTPASPTATGTQLIEAMTWSLDFTTLYAANGNQLGTLNTTSGLFTAKLNTVGSVADPLAGEFGNITVADVDGLSFDPASGVLYGVHRREASNTQLDVLIKIDPVTGKHINGTFGVGVDYIKVRTDLLATPLYEIDDISFDPVSGSLYAIANGTSASFSVGDRLVTLSKSAGTVSDIARITKSTGGNLDDVEGLSFYGDGGLFATSGYHAASGDTNKLWELDKETAVATQVAVLGTQSTYNDYEAVACQGGSLSTSTTPSNVVETSLSASIGDRVWADINGDSVQDAGEPGLGGVEVCATPTGGGAAVCDTTDAFGAYRINGLTNAASYNVATTPATYPVGYAPTTATTLTRTATTAGVNDADFGLRPPGTGSIGDTVCLDTAENGCDAGDAGLPAVTVRLYRDLTNNGLTGDDILMETATTDASGLYGFTGLHAGDYLVQVDTSSIVTSSFGVTATLGAAMDLVSGTNPHDVALSNGQAYTTADFGYNWGGSIGDFAWYDNNGDKIQDGGAETGAPDTTIVLYYDVNGDSAIDPNDVIVAVDVTDNAGAYLFDNLPPGKYIVKADEQQVPAPPSSANAGQIGKMVATTGSKKVVVLTANQDYTLADFGFIEAAEVEGTVFHDVNHSSVLDSGEPGLNAVTVTLSGTDVNNNPVNLTTPTDTSGEYKFIVPPGTYTITYNSAHIPAGLTETTTPTSITLTVNAGQESKGNDFGVDNTGRIGDLLWHDIDGDGVKDATEDGISGVTLLLYNSAGTTLLASTVTTASGGYIFPGLANGDYLVRVDTDSLPIGYDQTADPEQPGVQCTTCNNESPATVSGGSSVLTKDFGYRDGGAAGAGTVTLLGNVWYDTDKQGDFDETPPGSWINGVKVNVVCSNGFSTQLTTATSIGGNWSTTVSDNVSCTVTVDTSTLPSAAYTQTGDPDQPGVLCTTCDSTTVVVIGASAPPAVNFGYVEQLGTITGTVCAGSGDGVCNPGESALTGVTVTLTYAGPDTFLGTSDDISQTVTTNASGRYTFTNQLPGLYQIVETNPVNYASLADADGGNPDNISPVVLAAGQTITGRDFEDVAAAVRLTGTVFDDANGSQVQNGAEVGTNAGGLNVNLLNGSNNVVATTTVSANGLYTFPTVTANSTYTLQLTLNPGTPGQPAPAVALPSNWVTTGENTAGTPDGTPNSLLTAVVAASNVTQKNFGIEQLPNSNSVTAPSQSNPGGTISVTVPALSGSDPEDGVLGTGMTLTITSLATNGTLYYNNTPVTLNQVITNYDPTKLTVDPANGAVTVSFAYATVDAAGRVDPTPATVTIPFVVLDYLITKTLNTPSPVRKGETVSFTIRITNTGSVTLTTVPLIDIYVDGIIVYVSSTPSANTSASSQLEWTDLTAATANGFGRDLGPGDVFAVVVTFVALTDTSAFPGGVTINTATVQGASYDPDGPGGSSPQSLPDKSATAGVGIVNPTSVALAEASASYVDAQARLQWRTVNESDVIGFHIYRSENGGERVKLTDALIQASQPGQSSGASYLYTDSSVEFGKRYSYFVEMIGTNGPMSLEAIGEVTAGGRIFLPTVGR